MAICLLRDSTSGSLSSAGDTLDVWIALTAAEAESNVFGVLLRCINLGRTVGRREVSTHHGKQPVELLDRACHIN